MTSPTGSVGKEYRLLTFPGHCLPKHPHEDIDVLTGASTEGANVAEDRVVQVEDVAVVKVVAVPK